MYQNWFLDYASYVILERAVPHIEDGLKPVQRRILHSMKRMDDGRYNKVANIVGHTMQFHPHGDASIGDALVQMGQKDLLIDTQGNWGNILTGDRAAAHMLGQNVIIQSIGASSGVIVAGAIFTLPALYILGLDAAFWQVFLSSLFGGLPGRECR